MLLTPVAMFGASVAQDTYLGVITIIKSFCEASAALAAGHSTTSSEESPTPWGEGHIPEMISLLWPAYCCRNESSSQHHSFDCHSSN